MGSCKCDEEYVGSRCDKDKQGTITEVVLILDVLTKSLSKEQSYLTL